MQDNEVNDGLPVVPPMAHRTLLNTVETDGAVSGTTFHSSAPDVLQPLVKNVPASKVPR